MNQRDAIVRLRAQLGCGQEVLARKLGVALRTVAEWERWSGPRPLQPGHLIHLHLLAMSVNCGEPIDYFAHTLAADYIIRDAKGLGHLVFSILPADAVQLKAIQKLLDSWPESKRTGSIKKAG